MQSIGKYRSLDEKMQSLRLLLLNHAIDHPGPIPEDTAHQLSMQVYPDADLHSFNPVLELERSRIVKRNSEGIYYLYPLSTNPTPHTVTLSDGRSFYAMCAIDAMGAAVTWHQEVQIDSECADDGTEVFLTVSPTKGIVSVSPDHDLYVSYFDTVAEYRDFNC